MCPVLYQSLFNWSAYLSIRSDITFFYSRRHTAHIFTRSLFLKVSRYDTFPEPSPFNRYYLSHWQEKLLLWTINLDLTLTRIWNHLGCDWKKISKIDSHQFDWLIDWLIDWSLTPTLTVFQLYRGMNKYK